MSKEIAKGMNGYKGSTPKNVPSLTGKGGSKDMAPKKFGIKNAGEMYKKAPTSVSLGARKDMSSGAVGPIKQSGKDKSKYNGVAQPVEFSNASNPRPTKFVC